MESDALFVAFSPSDAVLVYDGFTNWDVGLLAFDAAGLHYLGDGTRFSLTRESIESVSLQRLKTALIPSERILLRYRQDTDGDPCGVAAFSCAEASSLIRANRETRALLARLKACLGETSEALGDVASTDSPYPPPERIGVRGLTRAEVYRPARIIGVILLMAVGGLVLGVAIGLPDSPAPVVFRHGGRPGGGARRWHCADARAVIRVAPPEGAEAPGIGSARDYARGDSWGTAVHDASRHPLRMKWPFSM